MSVSLDEDLVEEFEREDQGLSAQVNQALRVELERRRRNRLLVELLDQRGAEQGPVDEPLVSKYGDSGTRYGPPSGQDPSGAFWRLPRRARSTWPMPASSPQRLSSEAASPSQSTSRTSVGLRPLTGNVTVVGLP